MAPKKVDFFSRDGQRLGDKRSLEGLIHEITGIPLGALRGEDLSQFPVEERLRWRTGRNTKKIEDKAYCLLGIFDVSMSLRYGEGEKAVTRLEAKVKSMSKGQSNACDYEAGLTATSGEGAARESAAGRNEKGSRRFVDTGEPRYSH